MRQPIARTAKLGLPHTWIFILSAAISTAALEDDLQYKNRGNYSEGRKAINISKNFGLELVSAIADYQDQPNSIGSEYHARFYLNSPAPVCLTARERNNQKYYWLDQVTPVQPWTTGFGNEFIWPTATVLKPLSLKLYDIGMVARLNCESTSDEYIAPVVLFQTQAPKQIHGYVFTFKLSERAKLKAKFFSANTHKGPIETQELGYLYQPGIFEVAWLAQNHPEGDYLLQIEGYHLSNNQEVVQTVHFYHKPLLQ